MFHPVSEFNKKRSTLSRYPTLPTVCIAEKADGTRLNFFFGGRKENLQQKWNINVKISHTCA